MIATSLLPVYFSLILSTGSPAQLREKDTVTNASHDSAAIQLYHQFLSNEKSLYNGREYIPYTATLANGHPYFQSTDFVKGSVFYDGVLYEDIPILFDIIKNAVVIQDAYQKFRMQLIDEKISWFTINNTSFVHIQDVPPGKNSIEPGFYRILYKGNISLLKKESKIIRERLEAKLIKNVIEMPSFYIKKNNKYYITDSRGDVLDVLKDKKTEIRQFIRQKNLKISDEPEKALSGIVAYYNTITR